MMDQRAHKLTGEQKAYVVQRLGCFDGPREVAEALKEEFGVEISPQAVECYDPTKRAGRGLSEKWRDLFAATRAAFLAHIERQVPEVHRAVRIKHLARSFHVLQARGNYVAAADMLERIAKEMGNVHTNRREFSGPDGGAIQFENLSSDQIKARIITLLEAHFGGDADDAGRGTV